MNDLVNSSRAAVVAKVVSVSPPRWNSEDGSCWKIDPAKDVVFPFQYREAKVEIREVIFADESFAASRGQSIEVFAYGSGEPTGVIVKAAQPPLHSDQIIGLLDVNSTVLLLLDSEQVAMKGGSTRGVTAITGQFQGNWTVTGERAESVDARRSVPADQLKTKIRQEREAGRRPSVGAENRREPITNINPLGEPPSDTSTPGPPGPPAAPPCQGSLCPPAATG